MKKIALVLFLVLVQQIVVAQKNNAGYAGVYLTRRDFIDNNLSYKITTRKPGFKLEFPPIADWALTIRIVTPDSVNVFKPGTVFGYNENGNVYRYVPAGKLYVPEDYYKIVDDKGLIIYTAEFNGGSEYFYSTNLTSPIQRLNFKNIRQDFGAHPDFIGAVKRLNNREVHGDLGKKDRAGNFIINKIYGQIIKK